MKKITSLKHPLIKHLCKLRKNAKYRKENSSVLVSGKKIISDIAKKIKIKRLLISDKLPPIKAEETYLVTKEIMKKITNVISPEPIAAEICLPKEKTLKNKKFILVLDRIKDPGNLGTLIRTAHGLNFDGVIITPTSVDPYNDKALRAAKGSTFAIDLFQKTNEEIIKENGYTLLLADLKGKTIEEISPPKQFMLILSSESLGAAKWKKAIKVTIPMKKDIDSLNVAVSGGILMHLLRSLYE